MCRDPPSPLRRGQTDPVRRNRGTPLRAVALPGSGSDEVFASSVFAGPLRALGVELHAVVPEPGRGVVRGYRAALDVALDAPGPLLVAGISLGAHVAAAWTAALPGPRRPVGLLLALPAWTGEPGDAPASRAARITAGHVRAGGSSAAIASARAGSPRWLGDELARAWARYGDTLADTLDSAAAEPGPTEAELRSVSVPAGVAALLDDPVHPLTEAQHWCRQLPRAALCTVAWEAVGADPATLGRAAVLAWLRAGGRP